MEKPPQIKIGEFTVALLSDGIWRNDGGCMLGVVPRELWQREHPPDDKNRIRLNLTCPLIIKGNQAILVDTGIGNRLSAVERKIFDHQEGWLPEGLAALGMEPGDVTHVLLSHLHFDHCGQNAVFRHAPHFVQGTELSRAQRESPELYDWFDFMNARFELLDGDTELLPGLSVITTPGHTSGHQSVVVTASDGSSDVLIGDAAYTPRVYQELPAELPDGQAADRGSWEQSLTRIKSTGSGGRVHFCHHTDVVHG